MNCLGFHLLDFCAQRANLNLLTRFLVFLFQCIEKYSQSIDMTLLGMLKSIRRVFFIVEMLVNIFLKICK